MRLPHLHKKTSSMKAHPRFAVSDGTDSALTSLRAEKITQTCSGSHTSIMDASTQQKEDRVVVCGRKPRADLPRRFASSASYASAWTVLL